MAGLALKDVRKQYGKVEVIKGIDLDVADGEFVVFVGPSGCGKSTLLRMIAGLEEISSGTLSIGGRVVNDLSPKERGIAMVFQSYALYPHKTVYDNMAFGLQLAKAPTSEIDAKVKRAAGILHMEHLLDRKPSQLSGGQRQRVAIGRAIVRNPEVFLFDEPLSNLDAALRVTMRAELSKLHRDLGATMIYVTHDQVEAMTLADKIVVLEAGVVQQAGTPLQLYHNPQNRFVAGFIGSPKMNFIPVEIAEAGSGGVTVASADLARTLIPVAPDAAVAGAKAVLGIRPEHVTGGDRPVTFKGRVELVERLGHQTVVEVATAGGATVTALLDGTTLVRPGETLTLGFDPADAHLFGESGRAMERFHLPEIARMTRRTAA
ncbi:ABC transporter ATP-binding protein [Chthonobacter albigriseus]|uniref:ABC transporter ATP-binding protein n=1 Tax=Chthonobacter albigriseus TaxID=1683161 RepID=UPI0015EE51B9|nr:sn-glycerol-3-phosphate ABC transporter ATP-binding protein UgpC [Chthonobacter albigriseus]